MEDTFVQHLLVEGKNDLHVVKSLCNVHKVAESFDVVNCEGFNQLTSQLRLRLTNSRTNATIALVVDADIDFESRYHHIASILNPQEYDCPEIMDPKGLIVLSSKPNMPKIGIWIMPNNREVGMLEDFAISLVRKDDPLMVKAESAISEIEKDGIGRYKHVHRSKAKLHTYLAWQDEPGMPIGKAITCNVLLSNSGYAISFIEWINNLFNH